MTFTANDIVTVLAAVGVLATIIGGLIVNIIVARKNQAIIKNVEQKTLGQNKQLSNIEILVDGRYGDVLQELASVKKLLAESSGLASHRVEAEIAQIKSDKQEARVNDLKKENGNDRESGIT